LYSNFYSIICFSETWISCVFTDGMLDPKGLYYAFRKDRDDGFGGVVIFINKCIDSTPISVTNNIYKNVELIGVTVQYFGLKIVVCCLYCLPNLSCDLFKVTLDCLKNLWGFTIS